MRGHPAAAHVCGRRSPFPNAGDSATKVSASRFRRRHGDAGWRPERWTADGQPQRMRATRTGASAAPSTRKFRRRQGLTLARPRGRRACRPCNPRGPPAACRGWLRCAVAGCRKPSASTVWAVVKWWRRRARRLQPSLSPPAQPPNAAGKRQRTATPPPRATAVGDAPRLGVFGWW